MSLKTVRDAIYMIRKNNISASITCISCPIPVLRRSREKSHHTLQCKEERFKLVTCASFDLCILNVYLFGRLAFFCISESIKLISTYFDETWKLGPIACIGCEDLIDCELLRDIRQVIEVSISFIHVLKFNVNLIKRQHAPCIQILLSS